MNRLELLEQRMRERIPLTRALAFRLQDWQTGSLSLTAPLDVHVNDKGTFFAGSQAALFTLAGWALTTLEVEHRHGQVDVLAVANELKYTAPLADDMVILVTADEGALGVFFDRLERRSQARLSLDAAGVSARNGEPVSHWHGQYLARLIGDG